MKSLTALTVTTVILILLAWLPFFGPFVAGFAGGWFAGSVMNAAFVLLTICAGVAVIVTLGTFLITGIPWLSAAAGTFGFAVLVTHIGPLVIGTLCGAVASMLLAMRRFRRSL